MNEKYVAEEKENKKLKSLILLIMALITIVVTIFVIIIGVNSGKPESLPFVLAPMIFSILAATILILKRNKN
ncbi:hypothetical protein [Clostridium sp. UBA4548]|uniref:hypothetical protein n=1 Tax=Clostridium sp. UBA4548 TaxID=1946361 RepID=UPI0025BAFE5F|nr:hypothetical protein [Clostridium sp. UBA4548]